MAPWPYEFSLDSPPPAEEAVIYAEEVARHWMDRGWWRNPEAVIRAMGWQVVSKCLGAPNDGPLAMLVPLFDGGFRFVLDPWAQKVEGHPRSDSSRAFRLAHELGHVMFFTPGSPPRRVDRITHFEEQFCDSFADALLWTNGMERT